MLKIKDAIGRIIGILKDEDNEPEMVESKPSTCKCENCPTKKDESDLDEQNPEEGKK